MTMLCMHHHWFSGRIQIRCNWEFINVNENLLVNTMRT